MLAGLLAPSVFAGDDAISADARAALEAVGSKDAAALAKLVARPWTDVWAIVDDLRATGRADEARAVAAATSDRPDVEALRRFAAEPVKGDAEGRAGLSRAQKAAANSSTGEALRVLADLTPAPGSMLELRVSVMRGRLLIDADDVHAASAAFERAVAISAELGRGSVWEANRLQKHLCERMLAGRFREAYGLGPRMIEAAGAAGHPLRLMRALGNLASVEIRLSMRDEASLHLRQVRRLIRRCGSRMKEWGAVGFSARFAMVHSQIEVLRGDMVSALRAAETACTEASELHDSDLPDATLATLADTYMAIGANAEALDLVEEALKRRAQQDRSGETGLELLDLQLRVKKAKALLELERIEEAREVLEAARADLEDVGHVTGLQTVLVLLGMVHESNGEWPKALDLYERAHGLETDDPLLEAQIKLHMGDALARRGGETEKARLFEAVSRYEEALEIARDRFGLAAELAALVGLGEVGLARGQHGSAAGRAHEAYTILDRITSGLAGDEQVQARELHDRVRLYGLGIRSALATKDPACLFEMKERARAGALIAALGGRQKRLDALVGPTQREDLRMLRVRIALARAEHNEACEMDDVGPIRDSKKKLEAARREYTRLVNSLERDTGRDHGGPTGITDLAMLQRKLLPHDVMVLYSLLPEASWALIIARDRSRIVKLAPRSAITDVCRALEVESRGAGRKSIDASVEAIRHRILDPLDLPKGIERLLVVPDGILAHIPWPLLLRRPADPKGVSLLPSGTTYVRLLERQQDRGKGKGKLGLADPIYDTRTGDHRVRVYANGCTLTRLERSAAEVRSFTGKDDVVLLREKATETRLLEVLRSHPRWRSIHLACHGVLNERHPSHSALVLMPDDQNDGFLTALEISTARFDSDLVVFSGCETGRGRLTTGEGVMGLSRAAMIAGAQTVLVSLWRVDDDATAGFMKRFYEAWSGGTTVTEAVRRAQLRCEKESAHPRDWAAWVVWGLPE